MASPSLPADIDFVANKEASPQRMNQAMAYLLARIIAMEQYRPTLDNELNLIQSVGLQRLNEVLTPLVLQAEAIVSVGALLQATSTSTIKIATGNVVFTIADAQRTNFAPSQWMSALNSDASAAMAGLVANYDRTTGLLTMFVEETFGSGSYSSWQISPSSPPMLGAAVVDGGVFDSNTTTTSTSVPYVYSGPQSTSGLDGGSY